MTNAIDPARRNNEQASQQKVTQFSDSTRGGHGHVDQIFDQADRYPRPRSHTEGSNECR